MYENGPLYENCDCKITYEAIDNTSMLNFQMRHSECCAENTCPVNKVLDVSTSVEVSDGTKSNRYVLSNTQ